jgi:hypothetical protein
MSSCDISMIALSSLCHFNMNFRSRCCFDFFSLRQNNIVLTVLFLFILIIILKKYIGPSNKYIFRVGVGDILILLTV